MKNNKKIFMKRGPSMDPNIRKMAALNKMDTGEILSAINLLLRALEIRGIRIQDWENKKRVLKEIRPLYQKVYFFAAEPERRKASDEQDP